MCFVDVNKYFQTYTADSSRLTSLDAGEGDGEFLFLQQTVPKFSRFSSTEKCPQVMAVTYHRGNWKYKGNNPLSSSPRSKDLNYVINWKHLSNEHMHNSSSPITFTRRDFPFCINNELVDMVDI